MKIGILGTGNVGKTIGSKLVQFFILLVGHHQLIWALLQLLELQNNCSLFCYDYTAYLKQEIIILKS
jgi:lactate dehydrogenase-like 2-hydroxyacid dehydrogenase